MSSKIIFEYKDECVGARVFTGMAFKVGELAPYGAIQGFTAEDIKDGIKYGGLKIAYQAEENNSLTEENNSQFNESDIYVVNFNESKGITVIRWKDGTVTKVKAQDGEVFDREKGFALCIMKKIMGNTGKFNETLKKYCAEQGE